MTPLEEYKEKRDFKATPEPPGELRETGLSRFVVQKHQASHLHYDFRLEMDGVLKSWAVPKGPPEEPGVRRLAVQVEDHPVDYVDFAGVIPEGYGAGTVEIWDNGSYTLVSRDESKLVFQMDGTKLRGNYTLIKTGPPKQWILIKNKTATQGSVKGSR
jgi:DNA ligase D-like protein (predicted 3'-phosphoesterase)